MEIGIDCGGTKCEGIVIDNNAMIEHMIIATPSTKKVLFSMISSLLKKQPNVDFIGIGFPAPIKSGIAQKVNNIKGWDGINIEKEIVKKFNLQCRVENDANCFALAEACQKENENKEIVVGITLGTGLGGGIVINKKLFPGSTGSAGEINRAPFKDSNFEDYTSKQFFMKKYKKDPVEIFKNAEMGRKKDKEAVRLFAVSLGKMLANIILLVDPDCVIFGGNISRSFDYFKKDMLKEMKKYIFKQQLEHIEIKKSSLSYAGCIGAAMLKQ